MSLTLFEHVPNRVHGKVTIVNFYVPGKTETKVLVLTTDRHLLECHRKEIIFACDLNNSALKDVILPLHSSRVNTNELDSSNTSQISELDNNTLQFGKYISCHGCTKRLFVLIKAFDKLVVVERTNEGFKFIKDYSNVDRFEITDPESNYRAVVAVHFLNFAAPLHETFIENTAEPQPSTSRNVSAFRMDENLCSLYNRVSVARAELAMQQIATRKQFVSLKDKLMFGPDQIRSDVIEEKQPLGRYGDIWMRVVSDFLLIGIPVINNCSQRLTILQNVRAAVVFEDKDVVEYECELYQLKDDAYEFEKIDNLLDSNLDSSNELTFNKDWKPIKNRTLRPETSAVVVMKIKLNSFFDSTESNFQCRCFLLYDISHEALSLLSSQQYYVRTIEIDTNILSTPEYLITFDPRTTYKDLLAISATSNLFFWSLEHKSDSIVEKLSTCLINIFGFSRLVSSDNAEEKMDVDLNFSTLSGGNDIIPLATIKGPSEMFYHRPTGHNHLMGTLIRIESQPNRLLLKVYVREDYKALYIYSKLYREFETECKILPISYYWNDCYHKANLLNFYENLQKEIEIGINNLKLSGEKDKKKTRAELLDSQIKIYAQEMKTDCIFMKLNQL